MRSTLIKILFFQNIFLLLKITLLNIFLGKKVEARKVGANCNCKKACFNSIGNDELSVLLNEFNLLGSYDLQNVHLYSLITATDVQRKRTSNEISRRSCTFIYNVKTNGKTVAVCRKAFLSIHGISIKRLKRLQKSSVSGHSTAPMDRRGKHTNRPNKRDPSNVQSVKKHIELFPRYTSHYSRKSNPKVTYLSPMLSISKMYELYQKKSVRKMMSKQPRREHIMIFLLLSTTFVFISHAVILVINVTNFLYKYKTHIISSKKLC